MADAWNPTAAQSANLGMGDNPFLGQANPYLQQTIDSASADMVKNYNLTTQPAFNKAMVNSGSFGNEGVAQMNAGAQDTMQKNLANLSGTMRMQDYGQQQQEYNWQRQYDTGKDQWGKQFDATNQQWNLGFDRNVYNDAYSQNMNNLTTGMGMLGTMAGYTGNDLASANAQQQTPLDYWSKFTNQSNALGQGYGTTTGQQGTTSNPWASAIGGAQLGAGAYNWWNQNQTPAANPSVTGGAPAAGTPYDSSGYTLNNNFGGNSNLGLS